MGDAGKKIVVAKPVASRPYSNRRSFSDLLPVAMIASPPTSFAEATVAIRPKAQRFKPSPNAAPAEVSSLDRISESAVCNLSDKSSTWTWKADYNLTFLYKPAAKVVSRTTASRLAHLGNLGAGHQQTTADLEAPVHVLEQEKHQLQYQPTLNCHENSSSHMDMDHIYDPSNAVPLNTKQDRSSQHPASCGDRPSYDGYNWRKYGQKQVKGSEYPRSYYKCILPNCSVKKKVEKSLDGQIVEIVYKGEHNHPKPQHPKQISSGSEGQTIVSEGHGRESGNPLCNSYLVEGNVTDGQVENCNEISLTTASLDNDKPNYKKRKNEDQVSGADAVMEGISEPHSATQNSIRFDVSGDGFHWRKYGQKVVKGNSYPRSYYRCTSPKCNVRKYVEKTLDDSGSFITTYEGKHNHEMPARKTSLAILSNSRHNLNT